MNGYRPKDTKNVLEWTHNMGEEMKARLGVPELEEVELRVRNWTIGSDGNCGALGYLE